MLTSEYVKELMWDLGAELCGVAPASRFAEAPEGFHPRDIFPDARTVVVIAKRFPEGPLHASSPIPYAVTCDVIGADVTRITCTFCVEIERGADVRAVPVPTEPYAYWDAERTEGRGLLSLRHAGWLAGLGVMGHNTLLTNREYGNRIYLGAALLDVDLAGDALADEGLGCEECHLCVDFCPVHAIDGSTVNQKLCRTHSQSRTAKGYEIYVCHACRSVCPNGAPVRVQARAG
jgi:epoxyqueuosine reductase QueG